LPESSRKENAVFYINGAVTGIQRSHNNQFNRLNFNLLIMNFIDGGQPFTAIRLRYLVPISLYRVREYRYCKE